MNITMRPFFWILISVLNIVRVNIMIRLFFMIWILRWGSSEFKLNTLTSLFFSHSLHFHFQKNFRVVKTHFISCTDAFKAYQFSVITVQELAKPDKPPKILHPPHDYHSSLFRTTLISQKFSILNWHVIPMTVFLFLMKSRSFCLNYFQS